MKPSEAIKKVNFNLLEKKTKELTEIKSNWVEFDYPYRIFYNSFKMFNYVSLTLDVWNILFEVFGIEKVDTEFVGVSDPDNKKQHEDKIEELFFKLKEVGVKDDVISNFGFYKDMFFELKMNRDRKKWLSNGVLLVGGFEISYKIVMAALVCLDNWKNKKGVIFGQGYINSEEALLSTTMNSLNLRFYTDKDEEKKIIKFFEELK